MLFHGLVPFRGHRMDDFLISFGSHEFWHQRWAAGILHRAIQLKPEGNFWKDLVSEIRTATTCGKKERDGRTPSDAISVTACWVDCLLLFGFCVWFLFGFSFSYARLRRPRFSLCSCVPLSLAVSRFPSLVLVLVL